MTDIYHIHIKGHLDPAWASDFDGMTLHHLDNGVTRLSGPVADQAALHGILARIRDLGAPLLSVQQVGTKGGDNE
ncbi:MAG: hypothetical protein KJZ93_23635 [Caldilineaceae bacterium]|nr:hypothetical protein [Caldilineaceae bacterium]